MRRRTPREGGAVAEIAGAEEPGHRASDHGRHRDAVGGFRGRRQRGGGAQDVAANRPIGDGDSDRGYLVAAADTFATVTGIRAPALRLPARRRHHLVGKCRLGGRTTLLPRRNPSAARTRQAAERPVARVDISPIRASQAAAHLRPPDKTTVPVEIAPSAGNDKSPRGTESPWGFGTCPRAVSPHTHTPLASGTLALRQGVGDAPYEPGPPLGGHAGQPGAAEDAGQEPGGVEGSPLHFLAGIGGGRFEQRAQSGS